MGIRGAIPIGFEHVFPYGCYMVGEVEQVRDFAASSAGKPVFARDKATGEFVWQVTVIDCDPEAREKTVKVKVSAPVQPVPPAPLQGLPFIPVEFDGMTVTPWVNNERQAFSFRAREMRAPRTGAGPAKVAVSVSGKDAA
ncbi:plasmid replication, integration and excision activator [Sphaerisporangium sp. TRM90804]|uniref:plasmid replication, integration and excision activator n=1 Tax=Sphaerisporangium sp. TRM90804 TaxID=3031113 RepID=UPI002449BC83|nr:plasmid replication, integration and excision activator [Sphaerisporangium sp. TRM90804]MDH2429282.1 plasmid replication, integration and excision activator [Sphaerisporangium sp. TRM90804]